MTVRTVTPFLWFDACAEEAAKLYVSIFPRSKITNVARRTTGTRKKGPATTVSFRLDGVDLVALNGGPHYQLTPAFSFVVQCKDQKEIDSLWRKLGKGGSIMRCGWLTDRFGVTWQILPAHFAKLLRNDEARKAMMGMTKIDVRALEEAARRGA